MAGREILVPKLGLVTPTKELSTIPNGSGEDSDLMQLIARWPDAENFFLAVYHHTILSEEMRIHSQPAQGETRYKSTTPFPDAISLLSLLAKAKTRNELFTAVMIVPQMQTAVLAQQVAAISNLSNGRFGLGVGVGWNKSEYDAVGMGGRFEKRGKILNQQIPALEMMLTGKSVRLEIGGENLDNMAINPPAEHEVPIWVGGLSPAALERAAFYGSGWMPLGDVEPFIKGKEVLLRLLDENHRDPNDFGFMGRVTLGTKTLEESVDDFLAWIDAGVTHVVLTTTGKDDHKWQNHSALIANFLRETRWIRYPDSESFGSLFGHGVYNAPSNLLVKGTEKFCFELRTECRYLRRFLENREFKETGINQNEVVEIPHLSKNPLKVIECRSKSPDKTVWILQTADEIPKTVVVYDKEVQNNF